MHTLRQLESDLRALGLCAGSSVLMHSSYRSLGGVEGGAAGFFRAFLDLLGPGGTLVLPALSYRDVGPEQPVFDALRTPSCVGYLSEFFRTQVPGVLRSLHPTHSCCAVGRHAAELTAGHERDETPVGPNSPFAKLPETGGWILMLGCSADRNTSMHGVEETAEPPYLLDRAVRIPYVLRAADGTEIPRPSIPHCFRFGGLFCAQRYSRILDMLPPGALRRGRVLDAECVLMRASAVWEVGRKALERDPFCFVELVEGED